MNHQTTWMERAKRFHRLVEERDAARIELADAYVAIRWLRDGIEPIDVVAVSEAIRRAREAAE